MGNGIQGFSGDGGPATSAALHSPVGVAVDSGNLYIADCTTGRIRKVSSGIITTFAGAPVPVGIAFDSAGNMYIAGNTAVYKVSNEVITTFAGNPNVKGSSGDGGPATSATFEGPSGIAVDSAGNVFITDYGDATQWETDCRVRPTEAPPFCARCSAQLLRGGSAFRTAQRACRDRRNRRHG